MRNALLAAAVIVMTAALACQRRPPNLDVPHRGTISGRLTVSGSAPSINRRVVTASNSATGRTFRTHTNDAGDYTFLVPPGRYRLDVTLAASEALAGPNPVVDLHDDEIKADVNIAIVAHPVAGKGGATGT